MRVYDTTFIINPQTDDSLIDQSVRSVADLITGNGGRIINEDRMGTRRLAYQIEDLTQGYYTTFIFEGPSSILPILDRHFKLGESFMRHLTIVYDGDLSAFTPKETEVIAPIERKSTPAPGAAAMTPTEPTPPASDTMAEAAPPIADTEVEAEVASPVADPVESTPAEEQAPEKPPPSAPAEEAPPAQKEPPGYDEEDEL
ncbi:MAG: 30S ribosomal protein S6 [bacterium]